MERPRFSDVAAEVGASVIQLLYSMPQICYNPRMNIRIALTLLISCSAMQAAEKTPIFRAQDIDTQIEIGYGLAIADVDGDGKPDILLADKKQFVWYQNPTWTKHVLAENLTEHDNVCIAARDIDALVNAPSPWARSGIPATR